MFIIEERRLRKVVAEYIPYYNRSRPHQGIWQRIPDSYGNCLPTGGPAGRVLSRPVLGGLHHTYARAAYLN